MARQPDIAPSRASGIVDGSLTVLSEPGGGVALRVTVGASPGHIVEVVISADDAGHLDRSLATWCERPIGARVISSLPCRVGIAAR